MITLIHGDDLISSRNFLNTEKNKLKNPLFFDGKTITSEDLVRSLEGGSLFGNENEIIIENFLVSQKKSNNFDEITEYLSKNDEENIIYLWENQEIKGKINIKNLSVKLFKIPQNIFAFLDSLKPQNTNSIKLFHENLKTTTEDAIFYMIIRQFRLMLALLEEGKEIDEIKRLAPWQTGKLKSQALSFGKENLISKYNKLFKIDMGYKSGKLSQGLLQNIDFFLLNL